MQFQGFFLFASLFEEGLLIVAYFFQATFNAVLVLTTSEGCTENHLLLSGMHRFCYMPAVKTEVMSRKPLLLLYKHYMVSGVIASCY